MVPSDLTSPSPAQIALVNVDPDGSSVETVESRVAAELADVVMVDALETSADVGLASDPLEQPDEDTTTTATTATEQQRGKWLICHDLITPPLERVHQT